MFDVELWIKPINNGRNKLPIVRVSDKVFVYGRDGLHCYPTDATTRPSNWLRLGETALEIADVCARAFEIYAAEFVNYNSVTANSVQFARRFATALVEMAANNPIWEELSRQDWSNARIDANITVQSESSNNSSFNSRSTSSRS